MHSAVAPTNPRGIPTAPFVDKVEDYIATRADVEPALRKFQEMISYAAVLFSPIPTNTMGANQPHAENTNSWKSTPSAGLFR